MSKFALWQQNPSVQNRLDKIFDHIWTNLGNVAADTKKGWLCVRRESGIVDLKNTFTSSTVLKPVLAGKTFAGRSKSLKHVRHARSRLSGFPCGTKREKMHNLESKPYQSVKRAWTWHNYDHQHGTSHTNISTAKNNYGPQKKSPHVACSTQTIMRRTWGLTTVNSGRLNRTTAKERSLKFKSSLQLTQINQPCTRCIDSITLCLNTVMPHLMETDFTYTDTETKVLTKKSLVANNMFRYPMLTSAFIYRVPHLYWSPRYRGIAEFSGSACSRVNFAAAKCNKPNLF